MIVVDLTETVIELTRKELSVLLVPKNLVLFFSRSV